MYVCMYVDSLVPRPSRGRREKAWFMHGKALRNKYMDNHALRPDSGKYQHASTRNRAEKTAGEMARRRLLKTNLNHACPFNAGKGAFPWYKSTIA